MKRSMIVAALTLTGGLVAQPAPAQSQSNCAPRDVVLHRLMQGYGESRQSIGLGSRGAVIETFASTETGTWTITVTLPNGVTCLIASGGSYETLADAPRKDTDT